MIRIIFIISLLISARCVFSQITRDTADKPSAADTLFKVNESDSVFSNVSDSVKKSESGVDAVINYSAADSIVYDLKNKKIKLYKDAELTYKDLKLNSGIITVDEETQTLEAYGIPDTVNAGKFIQSPLMFQGETKYEGAKLTYNFDTQQGSVSMGFSDAEIGYYFGEKIKKVTSDVLFIKNGIYTTSSDREDPEYYFLSPKMKVIPNDKVIAQSVFLYIEGVPVFWIPFGVFPNRSGRSSGLIPPTFGDDGTYGKYISKLGYFWAINDYTDLALSGSYFSKGRLDVYGRFRYALKYNFSGSFDGGFSRIRLGESTDVGSQNSDAWGFNLTHNQVLTPTSRIDANMAFVSNKNFYNTTTNSLSELLLQNVISNLTYTKTWESSPLALNINYYRDQNLQTGDVYERLPLVNFSVSQTFPFETDYSDTYSKKIYEYFNISYSGSLLNNRTKKTIKTELNTDSTYTDWRSGINNTVNLALSPRFDFISLNPYFFYNEIWYNKYVNKTFNTADSSLITNDVNGFKALRYFTTGVSFSTRFVGIFTPRIFNLTGIRHTFTPAITYGYRPDFSDPSWGYYNTYTDASGKEVKYSIFEREVFGSAPSGESQSIALTLGNVFEMKTRVNDSTENKFQLLNFDAGVGYNFAADSLNLSDLATTFRTSIGSYLNISGGASFNFYKYDDNVKGRINKFLVDTDGRLADMTNFSLSLSTSFSLGEASQIVSEKDSIVLYDSLSDSRSYRDIRTSMLDEIDFDIPLSGGIGFNYSQSRTNQNAIIRYSNISGNIAFNLTQKWRFTFSTNYDIVNKQITAPYITAYRDLNSWEMNFNWYPAGVYRGFSLEIRIKAPQLRDIKVTKQTNSRGVFN